MAIDKLVDSAQLESDLTSVADAIRAKTGGTADLQFPADFVSEIGNISGGGGLTFDWADVEEVTIGVNSVTNMAGCQTYFSGYSYHFVILASPITKNRQFVCGYSRLANGTMNGAYRSEGTSDIRSVAVDTSFDGYLVEGSKYYILKKKA